MEILLAALLARCDQTVTTEQLMDEIWGDRRPRRASAALHVYVSQLRKLLNSGVGSAARRAPANPIITRPVGYLLHIGDDEFDAHEFQRRMEEGRTHSRMGRHGLALTALQRADALWRGRALGDLREGAVVYAYATWLEESRLECVELLIETYLNLGRHREVVSRLYALISEQPLREIFYRQLMLALYRSDRQADALMVFQRARKHLDVELGLEPCRALQDLHQSILVGGHELFDHLAG